MGALPEAFPLNVMLSPSASLLSFGDGWRVNVGGTPGLMRALLLRISTRNPVKPAPALFTWKSIVLRPFTNMALALSRVKVVQTTNWPLFARPAGVPLTKMLRPALSVDDLPWMTTVPG